jgi:hypothetical protein
MQKGSIHLTRLRAHPALYSATFESADGLLAGQWRRRFSDPQDLIKFLRDVAIPSPVASMALADMRQGRSTTIANVILYDHELRKFQAVSRAAPRRQTG